MNRLEELKIVELGEKIGYKKGFEDARKQFERPHGEWIIDSPPQYADGAKCSICGCEYFGAQSFNFCPNCGASMSKLQANDRQMTGKLNEESKDSHAEYWNSIGEWKEGETE